MTSQLLNCFLYLPFFRLSLSFSSARAKGRVRVAQIHGWTRPASREAIISLNSITNRNYIFRRHCTNSDVLTCEEKGVRVHGLRRSSRHRLSWFSSVFKQTPRRFASCKLPLHTQPSRSKHIENKPFLAKTMTFIFLSKLSFITE